MSNKIQKINFIKKSVLIMVTIFAFAMILSACGGKKVDAEKSPSITGARVISYNEGSLDTQWVQLELEFDNAVSVDASQVKSLRITIAGSRIKAEDIEIEAGAAENRVSLKMPSDAATSSVLKVSKAPDSETMSAILDESGKYSVNEFELEAIIPSGVELSTVSQEPGKVVKNVDTYWNIRSIAWIALIEDGVHIPVAETATLEMLDGYAAVHGHEFLSENQTDIADRIVEVLISNYSDEYSFSHEGSEVTAEKIGSDAELDIEIYTYLKINGEEVQPIEAVNVEDLDGHDHSAAHSDNDSQDGDSHDGETHNGEIHEGEDSHSHDGDIVKTTESNRNVSEEEQAFLDKLHISILPTEGVVDGTDLYKTIVITGEALPEEQIFTVRDLETLIETSFINQEMNDIGLAKEEDGYYGIDFLKFIELCGAETEGMTMKVQSEAIATDGAGQIEENSRIFTLDEILTSSGNNEADVNSAMLVFADENGALSSSGSSDSEISGPIALRFVLNGEEIWINAPDRIVIGEGSDPVDPGYKYHSYGTYLEMTDSTFTVQVYRQGAEYLGAVTTKSFTITELEQIMQDNPEAVARNFYGTIGNEPLYDYIGIGGWFDCFEGVDLLWLLTEEVGISADELSGYAELVDRDGENYGTIEDLSYFSEAAEHANEYYTISTDGVKVTGTIPMIACIKNSRPILPDHTHEGEAYHDYNVLNKNLEALGVDTEVGVVKNHNGPFIACLGNRDGLYGGNEIETGGDCVVLKLYLK